MDEQRFITLTDKDRDVLSLIQSMASLSVAEMDAYPHVKYLKIVNYPFKRLPV